MGYLVLESGEVYAGKWHGGRSRAGEVVFNTSHSGYEEIATDPSYYSQIVLMTAPMQGNYGAHREAWESRQMWLEGFVTTEIQCSKRDESWRVRLLDAGIPILTELDTRAIVMRLRTGTPWGALVEANSPEEAKNLAKTLIDSKRKAESDWVHAVSRREIEVKKGKVKNGPRVAVLDYGVKENMIRELEARTSEVAIFPSRSSADVIRDWAPSGILLSNGPGDPADVKMAAATVKNLLGWRPIMGICMGHQILSLALGASTYKLKFGHRGANHPVKDMLLNQIYVTSQNHGYAVKDDSIPEGVRVTHINLNDQTVEGIESKSKNCFSVQFHPESHPGPHEAAELFSYFMSRM